MENLRIFFAIALTIIALWLGSAALIVHFLDDWTQRGAFGDLFGSVNALFSGLAFAGVLYTIFLQRQEIERNRDDIEANRRNQQHAKKVMDAQLKQMKQTTRLHALTALMEYFNRQIADPTSSEEKVLLAREKRRETVAEIDRIIHRFNDDELDAMN